MVGLALAPAAPRPRYDPLRGFSFEIGARDVAGLDPIRPALPDGTMVSVTDLPGDTDDARVAAAAAIRRLGLVPMPHVAARRVPSRAGLHALLDRLAREAGVDRLFVVAGDRASPAGPFPDALALLRELKRGEHTLSTIGIAGHPAGHPAIAGSLLDRALIDKARVIRDHGLALEVTTQFAFDAAPIVAWVRRLRDEGIAGPLRLGLPGPADVGTLIRYAARCGVGASARIMAGYGASLARLLNTAGPDRLFDALHRDLDPEVDGPMALHFYPFGGLARMVDWVRANAARTHA